MKSQIAIVVSGLSLGGGVPGVASFLYTIINQSDNYSADVVSLSTAARDRNSIRLLSPSSWFTGIQVTKGEWQGIPYRHVGAALSEFEFQRYRSRRILTNLLNQYDLVQIVAGTPAWALTTYTISRPVCLFTATATKQERVSLIKRVKGWRKLWILFMTHLMTRIERQVLPHMAYVFGESEYTLDLLKTEVHSERLLLGAPGVDTDLFRPPTVYNANGYILAVGRFADPRKNVRLLFEAYHLLRKARVQAPRLVLAGNSAPSTQDWDYAASLGLSKYIELQEKVSVERLRELYQQASLFVLSSDEEGMGIVILEAMACGLPVISTDCGGPATAIVEGETGYLTPVGDATALAKMMQLLLDNPTLRQQIGQAGRQRVEERFSLSAAGKVYLDKYDELLGKTGNRQTKS